MYKNLLSKSQKVDRVYQFQYLLTQQEVARLRAERLKQEHLLQVAKQTYLDYLENVSGLYKGALVTFDAAVYEKNLLITHQLHEEWLVCEREYHCLDARLTQALDHLVIQNRKIEHLGEKIKSFRLLSAGLN